MEFSLDIPRVISLCKDFKTDFQGKLILRYTAFQINIHANYLY